MEIKSLTLELTSKCNLKCTHCYNNSGLCGHVQEMDLPTVKLLLNDLSQYPIEEMYLSGGEPLLHNDFEEILNLAAACQYQVIICTNGTAKDRLQKLINNKLYIKRVNLSLEGLGDTNDKIRGVGTFSILVHHTIKLLRMEGINVCVAIHLNKANKHQVEGLYNLVVDKLDCDIKFGVLRPLGRAHDNLTHLMLSPEELYECVKKIYELKKRSDKKRIWHDWDICTEDIKFYKQDYHDKTTCLAGRRVMLGIASNFEIFPCIQLRAPLMSMGIFNQQGDIASLVNSENIDKVYKQFNIKDESCIKCNYYKLSCTGGCPAVPFGLHNTLESLSYKDQYCFKHLIDHEKSRQ
ncbi:MAG: radical SAM protein [Nitrospirae bacterium]|nr:radical SAM protein [Nitrospirota bacterium]